MLQRLRSRLRDNKTDPHSLYATAGFYAGLAVGFLCTGFNAVVYKMVGDPLPWHLIGMILFAGALAIPGGILMARDARRRLSCWERKPVAEETVSQGNAAEEATP